jgi:hypothetical protein
MMQQPLKQPYTATTIGLLHTGGILLVELYSEAYKARCIRRLKEWGAPVSGWECVYTYDAAGDDDADEADLFTCELCDCSRVRYVHVMNHKDYFENVSVGCICAGIMEGDILAAKERERQMKNRSKRKANYLKRQWYRGGDGNSTMWYKNRKITIMPSKFQSGGLGVICDGNRVWKRNGKPIADFWEAVHTAFDLVDPPIGGQKR